MCIYVIIIYHNSGNESLNPSELVSLAWERVLKN